MVTAGECSLFRGKEPKQETPRGEDCDQGAREVRQEPTAPQDMHTAPFLDEPSGRNRGSSGNDHFVEKPRRIRNDEEHPAADVTAGPLPKSLDESQSHGRHDHHASNPRRNDDRQQGIRDDETKQDSRIRASHPPHDKKRNSPGQSGFRRHRSEQKSAK